MTFRGILISAQLATITVYALVVLLSEAPQPFSIEDWLFLLLPPVLFLSLLLVGLLVRPASPRWLRLVSTSANVLTGVALAFTLLVLPVSLFGNLTDMDTYDSSADITMRAQV